MTLFQLLIYSCVSTFGVEGELSQKSCRWDKDKLYWFVGKCTDNGASLIGTSIPNQWNKIEKTKCVPVDVE